MNFRAPGKWILMGEHAVVRGKGALVFPLSSKALVLHCLERREEQSLSVSADSEELETALLKSLQIAEKFLGTKFQQHFRFTVNSSIPLRAGLGSSAALAVAICEFLVDIKCLPAEKIFSLALQIENHFHGSSSGIDIAAVSQGRPIYFERGNPPKIEALSIACPVQFYLSDTGLRSSTAECVKKVIALQRPDLDEQMSHAVSMGREALASAEGYAKLKMAMQQARDCFEQWELFPKEVREAAKKLELAGAGAVKPTGSGGGGFLVSVWDRIPPADLNLVLAYSFNLLRSESSE